MSVSDDNEEIQAGAFSLFSFSDSSSLFSVFWQCQGPPVLVRRPPPIQGAQDVPLSNLIAIMAITLNLHALRKKKRPPQIARKKGSRRNEDPSDVDAAVFLSPIAERRLMFGHDRKA